MLFCHIVLFVHISLQRCENIPLLKKPVAAFALKVVQLVVRGAVLVGASRGAFRRDSEIFQFLTEDNNSLFGEQGVLLGENGVVERIDVLLLQLEEAILLVLGAIKVLSRLFEKLEDIVEALWVKLDEGSEQDDSPKPQ